MAGAILSALLLACSDETVAPPPAPPVNWASLDRPAVVDAGAKGPTRPEMEAAPAYAAALASPGFGGLAAHLDDDSRFAFPGATDARGREAVLRAHEALLGAFDSRDVRVGRVWRTASTQIVEWTLRGVQAHDWMGVAATHEPVVIRGIALLWTKDDASLTDIHPYFDVGAVRMQLGVAPDGTSPARTAHTADGGAGDARANAAATPTGTFDQTGADDEKSNVALYRATLDALARNDDARYVAAMADDVEVTAPDRPAPLRGTAAARAYFRAMHASIGQLDTTATDAWGVGPYAVVEYSIAGVQLGPIAWVPAQHDRAIRLHVVDVVEFQSGRIQRIWRYQNLAELVAHAG
jgi:ketosteroid isomerase-like protein